MVQSGLANLEESFKKAEASRNPAYRFPLPALGLVFADARLGAVFFFCPVVARLCFAAWDAPGVCVCVCVCVCWEVLSEVIPAPRCWCSPVLGRAEGSLVGDGGLWGGNPGCGAHPCCQAGEQQEAACQPRSLAGVKYC